MVFGPIIEPYFDGAAYMVDNSSIDRFISLRVRPYDHPFNAIRALEHNWPAMLIGLRAFAGKYSKHLK